MCRCEYCTKKLGSREIAHAVRYGTVDHDTDAFIPARDSAPTVICQSCGELLLNLIYVKLNLTGKPLTNSVDLTISHSRFKRGSA